MQALIITSYDNFSHIHSNGTLGFDPFVRLPPFFLFSENFITSVHYNSFGIPIKGK